MAGNSDRSAASRRRRRELRQQPASEERREWAELPHDVLTLIFRKVGGIEVLWRAQAVCRPWRQLALDPGFWRIIDMRGHIDLFNVVDLEKLTRIAVDRSVGRVEELYIDYFHSDDLLKYLKYVADRSTGLRRLVLISAYHVWDDGLVKFVTRCPLMAELLLLDNHVSRDYLDNAANEIADSMPQLRELQLIGNRMTNEGLHAILEKCLQLESLDIRACFNIRIDTGVHAKLSKIRNVKLPDDSTANYEFLTRQEEGMFGEDYYSGYSDTSLGSESSDDVFHYGTDFRL